VSLLSEIQDALRGVSKAQRTNCKGRFVSASSIVEDADLKGVLSLIEPVLESRAGRGERIVSEIACGEVVDLGRRDFRILGGSLIEFYDYEESSSIFIRVYELSDGRRRWIGVYMDENPETPWWLDA